MYQPRINNNYSAINFIINHHIVEIFNQERKVFL